MIDKTQEAKIYELSIEELRRMHDEVGEAYTLARTKVLAFLGGGFAFLTYLYGSEHPNNQLFIPNQTYGIIFYLFGLLSMITAIMLLFIAIQSVIWELPVERKIHKKMKFDTYLDFLKYTQTQYLEALDTNMAHCATKQKYLNLAFPLLVLGAILLLVIKNFS